MAKKQTKTKFITLTKKDYNNIGKRQEEIREKIHELGVELEELTNNPISSDIIGEGIFSMPDFLKLEYSKEGCVIRIHMKSIDRKSNDIDESLVFDRIYVEDGHLVYETSD